MLPDPDEADHMVTVRPSYHHSALGNQVYTAVHMKEGIGCPCEEDIEPAVEQRIDLDLVPTGYMVWNCVDFSAVVGTVLYSAVPDSLFPAVGKSHYHLSDFDDCCIFYYLAGILYFHLRCN